MSYSPFRHLSSVFWKRSPVHLTCFVTSRCNARCSFCFYGSNIKRQQVYEELSLQEIEKVSRSMGNLMWLAFSGGEVFLRQDIHDLAGVFYRNNKPSIILLSTNGLLINTIRDQVEEILRTCRKSTVVVKLSLDGPESIHDQLRGVKGAFNKVLNTYKALSKYIDRYPNFELGINTVFCPDNKDYMEATKRIVSKLDGVGTHTVSVLRNSSGSNGLSSDEIEMYYRVTNGTVPGSTWENTGNYRFLGAGLKSAQDRLQSRAIYRTMVEKKRVMRCYAGRLNIVLTENGDVYPCESLRNKLGNIREHSYDMKDLLSSISASDSIREVSKGTCYCTNECYMMTNIFFNPRMIPAVLYEYIRSGTGRTGPDGDERSLCPQKDKGLRGIVPNRTIAELDS
ncbi:MAG: radical SAM protein [Nitrospirota bacterium]|nr:MAG: radical SAM protein [Nitrospirota bacterium]